MIKEILEQLAPLDAQIAALKGSGNEMDAITAHASELAELAVEEDEILRTCGPLTAEDRVFLARHPERPHIDETVSALFTDFFEQRGDRQCKEDAAIQRFSAKGGLYISVLTHPTTGGVTASFASLGDIMLAEPGALIGFAGPRVIEQTIGEKLPAGFQRSEFQMEHGFVDQVVPRSQLRDTLIQVLQLHAGGKHE